MFVLLQCVRALCLLHSGSEHSLDVRFYVTTFQREIPYGMRGKVGSNACKQLLGRIPSCRFETWRLNFARCASLCREKATWNFVSMAFVLKLTVSCWPQRADVKVCR